MDIDSPGIPLGDRLLARLTEVLGDKRDFYDPRPLRFGQHFGYTLVTRGTISA